MDKKNVLTIVLIALVVSLVISFVYSTITGYAGKGGGKPPKVVAQCSDHLDNDGDGMCDFSWRKAYCSDGSTPGDSDCLSKDDNDESGGCIPACNTNDDCGASGYQGDSYCLVDGNVYKDFVTYTCDNAGMCSAVCIEQRESYLWENCDGTGCSSGACIVPVCGDGTCNGDESCSNCAQDCGACPIPDSCSDTDGGYNVAVKGTASGYFNQQPYSSMDVCVGTVNLTEYYCGGGRVYSATVNCDQNSSGGTCSNGACV